MTREEAICFLRQLQQVLINNNSWKNVKQVIGESFTMAIEVLEQPEIVRCAECKWFQCNMRLDGHLPKGVDEFECRHWCGFCDPTDFCSYAERRTNGEN